MCCSLVSVLVCSVSLVNVIGQGIFSAGATLFLDIKPWKCRISSAVLQKPHTSGAFWTISMKFGKNCCSLMHCSISCAWAHCPCSNMKPWDILGGWQLGNFKCWSYCSCCWPFCIAGAILQTQLSGFQVNQGLFLFSQCPKRVHSWHSQFYFSYQECRDGGVWASLAWLLSGIQNKGSPRFLREPIVQAA